MLKKIILIIFIYLTTVVYPQIIDDKILGSVIYLENSYNVSGSGILVSDSLNVFLVTAKHNLYNEDDTKFASTLTVLSYNTNPYSALETQIFEVGLKSAKKINLLMESASDKDDIAVVFLGKRLSTELRNYTLIPTNYVKIDNAEIEICTYDLHRNSIILYNEILIGGDILIIGYPSSIGSNKYPQINPSLPLAHLGNVAGKYDQSKTIILACPVYHGNSGGPVFQANKTWGGGYGSAPLIGIISEYIPYDKNEALNSGYSVAQPFSKVWDIIDALDLKIMDKKIKY